MCGIVGYIGERDSVPIIMDSLARLEYRGYDSAGVAVIDASGALVVAAPAATCSWIRDRFGRLLDRCSQQTSRELRLADEPERRALGREDGRPAPAAPALHINQQEVS